jgi:hypothetical protein
MLIRKFEKNENTRQFKNGEGFFHEKQKNQKRKMPIWWIEHQTFRSSV